MGKRRTRPLSCRNYAIGVRCAARPVHLPPGQINEWLDNGGLAPATVALMKGLLYPHGDRLLLADTAFPAYGKLDVTYCRLKKL